MATSVTLALAIPPLNFVLGLPGADAGFTSMTSTDTSWLTVRSFGLTQLSGTSGCITEAGGACTKGAVLTDPYTVLVSPDGLNVYVGSFSDAGVSVFARDSSTGALTQLSTTAGCITEAGGTCTKGRALKNVYTIAISPDGKQIYTASGGSNAVSVLDRDTATGALTQAAATSGCWSEDGSAGKCGNGVALVSPVGIAVSPDGKNVYAASYDSDAVAVFSRDPSTGVLTQLAGTAACVSENGTAGTCTDGKALDGAALVTVSPDGANVYVTSQISDAVAVFSRDPSTGALTQLAGTAGRISETGTAGACTDVVGLDYTTGTVVTPNGAFVYVSAGNTGSTAISVYSRDASTGALTQLAGTAGCWSKTGTGGACTTFAPLDGLSLATVSPDGENLYVPAVDGNAIAVFSINPLTGALSQMPNTRRCVSANGSGGVCITGRAVNGTVRIAVSPDGLDVYVTAQTDDSIAVFSRAR